MKEASQRIAAMSLEDYNKKLDEEERNMENEISSNKKNFAKFNSEEPELEDQELKMNKFRNYLFSEAKKVSTPQLLSQIVDIINNTYIDEVKMRNNGEDEKEDLEETVNETIQSEGNNISELNQTSTTENAEKKYKYKFFNNYIFENIIFFSFIIFRYYYRGIAYYTDKPPKSNQNQNNSDDSYVEDD